MVQGRGALIPKPTKTMHQLKCLKKKFEEILKLTFAIFLFFLYKHLKNYINKDKYP